MVYGRIPYRHIRRIVERRLPETILIVGHYRNWDEGGEVYGESFVLERTRGRFRAASAREVENYQRLDEVVDGVITMPHAVAQEVEDTDYRLYREEAQKTYEITGVPRSTPQYEAAAVVFVREADPERRYESPSES